MSMKFKVGDKIRVVSNYAHLRLVGEVYEITEIDIFNGNVSYKYIRTKNVPTSDIHNREGGMNEKSMINFFVLDGEEEEML